MRIKTSDNELALAIRAKGKELGRTPSPAEREAIRKELGLENRGNGSDTNQLLCLSDVVAEPIRPIWDKRISRGSITLIESDPGIGKTRIALNVAARKSRGEALPDDEPQPPMTTLIISAEDDLSTTIKPILSAMDADMSRIFAFDGALNLAVNDDIDLLNGYLEQKKPDLLILDPLMAFIGGQTDIYRANETRQIMSRLRELAKRHDCGILAIRHLTKSQSTKAIYRGLGSIDILASCRSVLLAGADPANPDSRVLLHIKSNLSGLAPALGYRIEGNNLVWTGRSTLTPEAVLGTEHKDFRRIEAESRILDAVQSLGEADVDMVAERVGIARITAQYHLQRMRESKQLDFKLVPVGKTKKILYSVPKNVVNDSPYTLTLPSSISSTPKDTISTNNTEDTKNSNDVNDIKEKENSINDSKVKDIGKNLNTVPSEVKTKEIASDVLLVAGFKDLKRPLGQQVGEGMKCKDGVNYCSLQSKYTKQPFSCGYTPGNSCPSWSKANE